ncbi:MAG: hypothetical protein JWN52_7212 [Actinomycetia bacterium]|nr:hypothetical protein [Actinomycetes bacterium]
MTNPQNRRTTRVNSYTKRDGTKVRSHDRSVAWKRAAAAWAGAGISGVTTLGLVFELGMTLISTLALVLTALLGFIAVKASQHAAKNRMQMRAKVKARPKARPRTTTTRRRR